MVANFIMYMCPGLMPILNGCKILLCIRIVYLMPISNGYKFYCVYASRFFIFGRGPCRIVILRGPRCQKGA